MFVFEYEAIILLYLNDNVISEFILIYVSKLYCCLVHIVTSALEATNTGRNNSFQVDASPSGQYKSILIIRSSKKFCSVRYTGYYMHMFTYYISINGI